MKKRIGILIALMLIPTLSACSNTGNGIGKDLENMGQWVQEKT